MKLVTCTNCGQRLIGPKTEKHPNGAPVIFGRFTGGGGPVIVKCHRCTNSMKLTAGAFNRLPELTPLQVKELGLYSQHAVQ